MRKNLMLVTLIAFPAWGLAEQRQGGLVIRVVGYTGISRETLREASVMAEGIFRMAGLETEWQPCYASDVKEACKLPSSETQLVIRILSASMQTPRDQDHPMGIAIPESSLAYVSTTMWNNPLLGAVTAARFYSLRFWPTRSLMYWVWSIRKRELCTPNLVRRTWKNSWRAG